MDRRTFISTTTAVGASVVAGCGGQSGGGSTDGDATDSTVTASSTTGTFRLLISDRPADIGDFDSLDVTFDRARVFRAKADETETAVSETEETDGEETEPETEEPDEAADDEADSGEETGGDETDADAGDGDGGFEVFDLDSPTVDLTEVVGEKAIGVLDGELEAGRYSKVELYVGDVEGVVDGETVPVKVPSEKLQIVNPFEIVADEAVEFVFDINVVEKGPNGYNLLPVIGESGVAGKDVEVEEVESEETTATETTATES
ncbi:MULTISPECIES: DUF4382 domain-containing protein [Haloarcula]|uniref:DUF4382 domain-containing protein n=1 Tax=Haloarcula pellucida TaxID=1427151 RepID=A0A830GR51_9EURY|nr:MULTISPECIES: DUF4382 domain-containing protein [Halomicroarcula]MBX0349541.1 DUF4382 domain-containing protein [Halomicroarcula pellucida]MDS0278872.1 DUF4382 domain-containing protein [Halomicroarcula sp. S1AR25-4]GGO02452.1 hypothetical protein GCM10009030_37010 [Halomicroarcula pellucida]